MTTTKPTNDDELDATHQHVESGSCIELAFDVFFIKVLILLAIVLVLGVVQWTH